MARRICAAAVRAAASKVNKPDRSSAVKRKLLLQSQQVSVTSSVMSHSIERIGPAALKPADAGGRRRRPGRGALYRSEAATLLKASNHRVTTSEDQDRTCSFCHPTI